MSNGSNRLLVAVICMNDGAAATHVANPITYGGKTLYVAEPGAANRRDVMIYYLKEADIATASGSNFNITITGGSVSGLNVYLRNNFV